MATLGPKCVAGLLTEGRAAPIQHLAVHHLDGNPMNHDPENLRLVQTDRHLAGLRTLADGLHVISEGLRDATQALERIVKAQARRPTKFQPAAPPDQG
jgi:hypothetical protein